MTMRTVRAIPQMVIDARTARGWTQDRLAEKAQISKKSVENAEAGKPVYRGTIGKLAAALETTVDALMGITGPSQDNTRHKISFDPFIDERILDYAQGTRQFLLDKWDAFLTDRSRKSGCFLIAGQPGVGKSAFLAKLIRDRKYDVHHFNITSQAITSPGQFIANLFGRLSARFRLPHTGLPSGYDANSTLLRELLAHASHQLDGKQLVIAIDALDEVDMGSGHRDSNVLFLPSDLPEGVYIIATCRSDRDIVLNSLDLEVVPLAGMSDENLADVRTYLRSRFEDPRLAGWLRKQRLSETGFIKSMVAKSEGNFMYLRYVLPELAAGVHDDLGIRDLPLGLQNYYESHWRRMGMTSPNRPEEKITLVYVLSSLPRPVSCRALAQFAGVRAVAAQQLLDEWRQFLHVESSGKERRYSFYHKSFTDFLGQKEIIQAAGVDLGQVARKISGVLKNALGR